MIEGHWMRDVLGDEAYERVNTQFDDKAVLGTI